jgi:hypothetical protein
MKSSPSKSMKTSTGKKRSCDEATGSVQGSTPPASPPRPNLNKEWKKSKAKTEDLLVLVNNGFLREKEMDMWHAAVGDPYPMEKNPNEIPMFARFVECGLALLASDFFKGLLKYYGIEYLNLNPNGIFHISVFVHFCEAFVGIKPHWVLFRKFFHVKPQPSANDPRVVGGAGIQMREDTAEQYLLYKLLTPTRIGSRNGSTSQSPPRAAEAEQEAAKALALLEHRVDHAEGYSTTRAAAEDQGFERSRAEGRTRGLQLHEEEDTAANGA